METKDVKRCDKDGCCNHLAERLTRGKGFNPIYTVNINNKVGSARSKFKGVSCKTSAKDAGLMLNYCPFCGGEPGDFQRIGGEKK